MYLFSLNLTFRISKLHVHFLFCRSFQRICESLMGLNNVLACNRKETLAPQWTPKLSDDPLSATSCLFSVFAATFYIWRSFRLSVTWANACQNIDRWWCVNLQQVRRARWCAPTPQSSFWWKLPQQCWSCTSRDSKFIAPCFASWRVMSAFLQFWTLPPSVLPCTRWVVTWSMWKCKSRIVGYSAGKCDGCDDITSLCFITAETLMLVEKTYWA